MYVRRQRLGVVRPETSNDEERQIEYLDGERGESWVAVSELDVAALE